MKKIKDQIVTMLIEHSRIIYSVISDMGVYYTNWAEDFEKNVDIMETKRSKMQLSEEEGDGIKIRVIKDFSEAGSQGLQPYMSLILRMDNVINSALEFSDILAYLKYKPNDDMKKLYHKLINNIIQMADVLKKTIKSMRDNPDDVFTNTTTIHELENDIDSLFREFLNYLYNNKDLEIGILLQIRDSVKILEELADRIHDIADLIRVLLYQ